MDSAFGTGVTQQQLDAVAAQIPATLILPGQTTVATLPLASLTPRRYIWVTDLFGGPGDYCISDGTNWKPVRPLSTVSIAPATTSLQALVNAPTIIVTGTLGVGATANITFSSVLAYPGAKFRTLSNTTGLGTLNLIGTVTMALALNKWADHEYVAGIGWMQTASGGLL